MIKYKILNDDIELSKLYKIIYKWDKKHMCFDKKYNENNFKNDLGKNILMYLDDKLIGYGGIRRNVYIYDRKIITSIGLIISPEYRGKGYSKILLDYLINYVKKYYKCSSIRVEILKSNIVSITLIENNDFEFINFDEKKIIFEKKLK